MDTGGAVVTGASSGIGRGISLRLLREGHLVFGVARRRVLLDMVYEESRNLSGSFEPVVADLSEATGQAFAIREVRRKHAMVSVIVNNAGGSVKIDASDPEPDWAVSLELQFHAARRLADAFVPDMVELGFGRIVNIGAPLEPPSQMNGSAVAKGALAIWSKIRSTELGKWGITVNTIAPGRVMSEQVSQRLHPTEAERVRFAEDNIPLGYIGQPDDIASLVSFLVSDEGRYITGELINVDGGLRKGAW